MSQQIASKFISLVPTNGTEFTVQSGQKLIFELNPSLGLVKGRDSYLTFDVLNNSSDKQRLMLNNSAGVDSLIDRVDIYSLRTGQHLETMQNYNQWMAIANQYLFEDKTNLQAMSGCGAKVHAKEVNAGGVLVPTLNESENINNNLLSPINTTGEAVYNFRRYTSPLKTGIMRYWDDERLCNVIGLQGLRIEITLAEPAEACFNLVAKDESGVFHDITEAGLPCADIAGGAVNTITTTDDFQLNAVGLCVDNKIEIFTTVTPDGHSRTITGLVKNGDKVDITFNGTAIGDTAGVVVKFQSDTRALKVRPEFKVLSIAPPPELVNQMANGFNYEFTTFDHFVDNIPQNARKHLIELNSVASRAVCVMTAFSNVEKLGGRTSSSLYAGDVPNDMNLNSVVYFLKSRLVPVRPYDPRNNQEKIIALHEIVKSLNSINKEAKDLGNSDGLNAQSYTNTFMIGRQLARSPYYYNLGEAEGQIRLGFSAGRAHDILANTFVWSRKIVSVTADGGVAVVL